MSVASIPAKVKSSTARNESESFLSRMITQNLDDLKSGEMWRACFAELVGVFFLAFFTIGVGVNKTGDPPVPLLHAAIGVAFFIASILTALSTVSGAHVNPAISIGFLVSNQITFVRFVLYTIFQSIGAIVGTAVLRAILPSSYEGPLGLIQPAEDVPDHQAVGMEIMITALLLFNTISFVDKHREDVQGSIPLMVGVTVAVNILAAANVSGGCMNPARALGPAVYFGEFDKQWIYWVGPLTGGAVGAFVYDFIFSTRPATVIGRLIERTTPSSLYRDRVQEEDLAGIAEEESDFIKLNPSV